MMMMTTTMMTKMVGPFFSPFILYAVRCSHDANSFNALDFMLMVHFLHVTPTESE